MQAMDKDASPLEIGIMIGIASLTLTIFAPIVGYFVSFITHSTLVAGQLKPWIMNRRFVSYIPQSLRSIGMGVIIHGPKPLLIELL